MTNALQNAPVKNAKFSTLNIFLLIVVGLKSYLIGLKLVFCPKVWKFVMLEVKMI